MNVNIYLLIVLLAKIKKRIIDSDNFKCSLYKDKEEFITFFQSQISKITNNDLEAIDGIVNAFGNNAYLHEIALNGDWQEEYDEFKNEFNEIIMLIRTSQFNDKELFNNIERGNYTNGNTYATSPGRIQISNDKWDYILKVYKLKFFAKMRVNIKRAKVQEYVSYGDTNPALVISIEPLIVSAYSTDLDAVAMLRFPQEFVDKFNLKLFDKLISVNVYFRTCLHYDIFCGENYMAWADFNPTIVNFLSDEADKIKSHVNNILDSTWEYVKKLSIEYRKEHKSLSRKGFWFI